MSGALAEALVAAQRRAMQAVEKAYVAGTVDRSEAEAELVAVGARDEVDRLALMDALDLLRKYGAPLPSEPPSGASGAPSAPAPASDAQWHRIKKDCREKGLQEPDGPLSKEQASKIIDEIAAGSYDAAAWSVPF